MFNCNFNGTKKVTKYIIKDVSTGKVFFRHNDYDVAARMFFRVFDILKYPEDDTYLRLIDTTTNRSMSVVVGGTNAP